MSKFKPGNVSQLLPERPKISESRPFSVKPARQRPETQSNSETMPVTPDLQDLAVAGSSAGGASQIAFVLTMLFIFFKFSFLHELLTAKIGVDLHILMLLGGLSVLAALLAGGITLGLKHRIAIAWFAFAACMTLATAFSIWKGGSFAVLLPFLRTTLILVVLIPAVTQSSKSFVTVLKTIGIGGLGVILLGLTSSDFRTGRLELTGAGASIENSNDYAAFVMLVMPAIGYWTMRKGSNIFLRVIGLAALGLGCFLVLSTGSRGALVSIFITVLYLLKVGSIKIRAAILVGLPVMFLMAIPFLPQTASVRLLSLFSSSAQTSESFESQTQRTALLMESLVTTAQHPLLGVGPGTFQEYQAELAAAHGQKGMWHETHNAYTQISSECGVPAFIFYMAAIFMTLKVFRKGRKSANSDIREVSSVLSLMLVSFAICMFFLAQGYGFGFPVMGGLAIAMDYLLKREASLELPVNQPVRSQNIA